MSEATKKILMNREIIAIAQDPGAYQVGLRRHNNSEQFLAWRLLTNGDIALGVFNMGDEESTKWCGWILPEEFGWTPESGTKLIARDLWDDTETTIENDIYIQDSLPAHACKLYRISLVKK